MSTKGRNPVRFSESEIYDVLSNVSKGQQKVSVYILEKRFSQEMKLLNIKLEKSAPGPGRMRKTFELTDLGKNFLKNYQ